MVREFVKKKEESQGVLTACPNPTVLSRLRFKLMFSVSAKIPCQGVMENFLRSGRSQGK